MKDNFFDMILNAEKGYHSALNKAMAEAEEYVDRRREEQGAYIEELRQGWIAYEKAENEGFAGKLSEEERKMEAETKEYIGQLRARQEGKADAISERIKEEVLSSIWQ